MVNPHNFSRVPQGIETAAVTLQRERSTEGRAWFGRDTTLDAGLERLKWCQWLTNVQLNILSGYQAPPLPPYLGQLLSQALLSIIALSPS